MRRQILLLESQPSVSVRIEALFFNQYVIHSVDNFQDLLNVEKLQDYSLIFVEYDYLVDNQQALAHLIKNQTRILPVYVILNQYDPVEFENSLYTGVLGYISKKSTITCFGREIDAIQRYLNQPEQTNANGINQALESVLSSNMQHLHAHGWALNCIEQINRAKTVEALVDTVLSHFDEINIALLMELNLAGELFYFDCTKQTPDINCQKTIELFRGRSRVERFANRALFYDEHIALLIKSMPEDEILASVYIDVFAKIIPLIDSQLMSLINQIELNQKRESLENLTQSLKQMLYQSHREKQRTLDEFRLDIHTCFDHLLLTDEQEALLNKLLEHHLLKNDAVDESLKLQIEQLESAQKDKCNWVIKKNEANSQPQDIAKSVELF